MVDFISNAPNPREPAANQNRALPLPAGAGAVDAATKLSPHHRVEILQATLEKLIKKSLPPNSRLQVEQDKGTGSFIYRSIDRETGEVVKQWPSEQLLGLREDLKEMEGLLLDKQV